MPYNRELFGLDYDIPTGELIDKYRENMVGIMSRLCPRLHLSEVEEAVCYSDQLYLRKREKYPCCKGS